MVPCRRSPWEKPQGRLLQATGGAQRTRAEKEQQPAPMERRLPLVPPLQEQTLPLQRLLQRY